MRHTLFSFTALLLIALQSIVLTGCESAPETSDKDVEPISYKQLLEKIAESSEDNELVIIDVRTLAKFEAGHITGAINVFLPELRSLRTNDPRVSEAEQFVVYGDGFSDSLSPIAAKDLLARGFTNVYDFRGGWEKWKKEQAFDAGAKDGN